MRKNDAITFEIGRNDLEAVLGNLSLTIAKMEKTQEALKGVVDVIRTALWEDEDPDDEPDCEDCDLPCRHNPKFAGNTADGADNDDREILGELKAIAEAMKQKEADMDAVEQKLKEDACIDPVDPKTTPENNEEPDDDEDEAESLAIELLKAVFSTLAELIDKEE